MTHTLGFSEIYETVVAEVLNFEEEPLINSELFTLINLSNRQQIQGESEKQPQIPLVKLPETFSCIEKAVQIFEEFDDDGQ